MLSLLIMLTHICLFLPFFFPSLWLWATLSGNGLYFLTDGTCAAGNDSGEDRIVGGEKEQIEITKGRRQLLRKE